MSNVLVWLLSFILSRRYWYRNFYLQSEHWRSFRTRIGNARKWHCQELDCREYGFHLDLHHLKYNLWREKPSDVRLLCRKHHKQAHENEH